MYNALIVDDEPIEREAMRMIIQENYPGIINVVGEAENGYEAIDLAKKKKPDIIVIDINMPGINGLETIQQMLLEKVEAKFIIVTSYNKFEYAQSAIRLGVEDFILKPTGIESIKSTFVSVMERIDLELESMQSLEKLNSKLDKIRPIIEADIINMLIEGKDTEDYATMFRHLNFSPLRAFVLVCEYRSDNTVFIDRLEIQFTKLGIRAISDISNNLIVFIIFSEENGTDFSSNIIMKKLEIYLNNNIRTDYVIGAGEDVDNLNNLVQSYHTAIKCFKYGKYSGKKLVVLEYMKGENIKKSFSLQNYVDGLVENIISNNTSEVDALIDSFFIDLSSSNQSMAIMHQYSYQAIILIEQKISNRLPYMNLINEITFSREYLLSTGELKYLKGYFKNSIDHIIIKISSNNESKHNSIVLDAIQYIETNYTDNFTLEELAIHLKVSSFHLCKVLKKQTGKNFSDILNECRLNKAKDLLKDDRISIKEVTYSTGFNSPHYFARIFKKYTGVTPTEFKNQCKIKVQK
ncbi:MAG: response regulator [Spirochaetaceae bacterium]